MFKTEEIKQAWQLANDFGIRYFGAVGSNAKTVKSDAKTKYLTHIMYMAPSTVAGPKYNVCPMASKGCSDACLFTAGHGWNQKVRDARILRTKFWFQNRDAFKICIFDEIQKHVERCKKLDKKPAVRLNGTSDIAWEVLFPKLFEYFGNVQFYDYTKIWTRLMPNHVLPKNYHLTLSRSEANQSEINKVIKANPKANIAVVFETIPEEYLGRKVIIGDEHDLRVLDPKGIIVGLIQKGDAKSDDSGFVIRSNVPLTVKKKELIYS